MIESKDHDLPQMEEFQDEDAENNFNNVLLDQNNIAESMQFSGKDEGVLDADNNEEAKNRESINKSLDFANSAKSSFRDVTERSSASVKMLNKLHMDRSGFETS